MKELNEKQRADHADRQYKLVTSQIRQLESRNEELETKFKEITKINLELQKTERELRDQVMTSIPKQDYDSVVKKFKDSEAKEIKLKIEADKLKEISDIAQSQLLIFEMRKNNENLELEALRHEIIDLTTQTDEKSHHRETPSSNHFLSNEGKRNNGKIKKFRKSNIQNRVTTLSST